MKVGFIGPGKVGVSLGRYFTHKGIKLTGFYGRNIETTKEAAKITKSKFYNKIQDIIKESDILFITTPDDIISIIDRDLSKFDLTNKSICHASGSIQSNVLYNAKCSGALIYSIHPIFAFSKKDTDLKDLESINFSIEGDFLEPSPEQEFKKSDRDVPVINLIKSLGNKYFIRDKKDSSVYHLANVFVSNLTLSLLNIGVNYLKQLGLNEKESFEAIYPLVEGNINSIREKGFVKSLTGPVLRGDITTLKKHLSVLEEEDTQLYKILSMNLLKLVALRDNKMSNENAIENFLNNSEKHLEIYKLLGGLES